MPTKTRGGERAVHRELRRGMKGPDVRQLQRGINHKADAYKLDQFAVKVDGDLGVQTESAAKKLLYAMGVAGRPMARARGYDYRDPGLTEYAQRLLRGSRPRTKGMKALATARRPKVRRWRRGRLQDRAYKIAESLIGVMEEGGNNAGRKVGEIIRSNGGVIGEPWCGDFVAYCYRNAGSKAVTRSWAAVRLLLGVAGIKHVSTPKRGDLVRFTFDHVGMFVKDNGDGTITTIEGNTGASGAVSDSATGGDGVYLKVRDKSLVNDYLRVTR